MSVHVGGRGFGHVSRKIGTVPTGPNPANRVTLAGFVPLADLNPIVRNDNVTSSALEAKAGPQGLILIGSTPTMFVEGVHNTGYPANNGQTAPLKATASKWQGTWTVSPSTPVITPGDTTTWEYNEFSPASVINDAANSRLVMFTHGGNNNGPRQIGRAFSTDGTTGQAWTKDAGNPIMTVGTAGSYDDKNVADFKVIQNPFTGAWFAIYRATKNGAGYDGSIARATINGLSGAVTKTGEVLVGSGFASGGISPGSLWYDAGGRLHMVIATTTEVGLGYSYSDDDGATWAAISQISSSVGGDVSQGVADGDVLFTTYGRTDLSFATNPPMRGVFAGITPLAAVSPTKVGKFYLSQARTDITAATLINQTTFGVMGRFRAYRTGRAGVDRHIYTEFNAFNLQFKILIVGASSPGNAGKLYFWLRNGSTIAEAYWSSTIDDAAWHKFVVRRISLSSWELIVDGGTAVTSAIGPAASASATTKAVGAWSSAGIAAGEADGSALCTISKLGVVHGYAPTYAEASAWIDSGTALGGGTIVTNFPTDGTDSGSVVKVEAS